MLRLNFLAAALGMAVLASCVPSDPAGTASEDSLRRQSAALTTSITVPWSGDTGGCLSCRTGGGYQCVTALTRDTVTYMETSFTDPVPGALVTGITATVHGRLTMADRSTKAVHVMVNGQAIGNASSGTERACTASDTTCDPGLQVTYTNTSGIPGYLAGSDQNKLKVGVVGKRDSNGDNSTYCVSHVELTFTYSARTLALTDPVIPTGGSLSFGNQKNDTTSGSLLVTVRNTGQLPVKSITPSIKNALGGTFAFTLPSGVTAPFDLAVNATIRVQVTFKPAVGGGPASGTLSFVSNETGFPAGYPTLDIPLSGTGVESAIDVSPAALSLSFPSTRVGAISASQKVTVRNVGNVPSPTDSFNITSIAVGPGQPFDVNPKPGSALSVGAGTSGREFDVTFNPTAEGPNQSGTLTITTDDPDPSRQTIEVYLSGTAVKPTVSLNKDALPFAALRVGGTSAGQTVTVSNSGSARLNVSSVSVEGPFAVSSTDAFFVEPKDTATARTLTVTFKPTEEGADQQGRLIFQTDDPDNRTATVTLSGTGVKSTVSLDKTALPFGSVRVGNTSAGQVVKVGNSGSARLNVTSVSVEGPFVVSPTEGFTVEPGATPVPFTVTFKPTLEGVDQQGRLVFNTDDPDNRTATVTLSGTGVKPTMGLSPTPLTFDPQRVDTISTWKSVMVSNNGSERLEVSAVSIAAPFELLSTEPFFVEPKSTTPHEIKVRFKPTSEGANQSAFLTLTTNEPGKTTATLAVSGSGVKPNLVVTPATTTASPLTFTEQRVDTTSGPRMVTVSNTSGSGPIRITSMSISTGAGEPFSVSPPEPLPLTLAAGQEKAFSVTFNPKTEGGHTGTLTLTTDYLPLPFVSVYLSGTGVKPTLQVSPTTELDFGLVRVGDNSAAKTVKLSNIGTGTLRIESIIVSAPFKLNSTQPFDLKEPKKEETLSVTFHPTDQGVVRGTITFTTNDPDSPTGTLRTIQLVGNGEVLLTVPSDSNNPVNFGDVRVGTIAEQQVTFTNSGPVPITVQSVSFRSDERFSLEGLPVELKPGTPSAALKLKFSPNATGVVSGRITVQSTATNSPHTLYVTGRGTESRVVISLKDKPGQTALDFGDVEVLGTKQEMVRLTNVGGATLDLKSAAVVNKLADGGTVISNSPFEYRGQNAILDIAPDGGFVDLPVAFTPTENGSPTATLVLNTNAVNNPVEMPLLGNGVSARLSLLPTALTFPPQRAGIKSPPQTVYITNDGRAELRIEGFTFTNNDFAISSPSTPPTPQSPLRIQPGNRAAIEVTFTPTVRGQLPPASMTILSNAVGSASSLTLNGKGVDGVSNVSPSMFDFLRVEVGFSSAKVAFKVTNTGDAPLKLKSAAIQNPSAENPFIISGFNAGVTLRPTSESTDVHEFFVTFSPLVNGYQTATLVLETDSWINPKHNVTLVGTGEGAEVELIPPSLGFAKTNVGDSTTGSLSIKNKGVRTLRIFGISFEGKNVSDGGTAGPENVASDFSVGRSADGGTIFTLLVEPEGVIPVDFKFSPTAVGFREARGVINSNARTVKFDTSGQATSPVLAVEPATKKLEIAGVLLGKTSTGQIRITNTGDGPVSIGSVTLSQTGTLFNLVQTPVPIGLAPNASVTLFVTFSPTEAQPSASAQLIAIPSSSYVPQVLVEIVGVGVRDPVSVESELDFGQHLVGSTSLSRTLHVSNNTDSSITLTGVSFLGTDCTPFKPATLPTSVPLVRNQPFHLNVTFRPRAEGDVNCVMRLFFAQLPEMQVPLRGKGIPSVLSVSPSTLDFGTLRAATGVREAPITLLNLSSDPITLAPPEVRYTNGEPFIFDWASLEGMVLNPGEPIIRTIKYQPAVESFSDTTVFFGTTSPTTPQGVELKLKGRATKRILNADVTSLDFGRLDANKPAQTKTITITNKSPQPQRVMVALKPIEGSPFAVKTSGLEEAIAPEGTATISVTFDPDKAGEAEDEVQIRLQGVTDPELQIPVKGIGRALTGGGGGCSCGTTEAGSAGMLMLLALVGLGSRRRRRE